MDKRMSKTTINQRTGKHSLVNVAPVLVPASESSSTAESRKAYNVLCILVISSHGKEEVRWQYCANNINTFGTPAYEYSHVSSSEERTSTVLVLLQCKIP